MLNRLFRRPSRQRLALDLYARAVDQARRPVFFEALGVEDRIDARFELYTLHVLLLIMRLRDDPTDGGADLAQALFDTYVSALDNSLRELGVGDLSISKKMRKLGESMYGRMSAYEEPLRAGDLQALAVPVARNILGSDDPDRGLTIARYALEARDSLATQDARRLIDGPAWPEITR